MTSCIPQLSFSFYRHRSIRADFSGGQITSDAGLLPLRAFGNSCQPAALRRLSTSSSLGKVIWVWSFRTSMMTALRF